MATRDDLIAEWIVALGSSPTMSLNSWEFGLFFAAFYAVYLMVRRESFW